MSAALDTLRVVDLVAQPAAEELLVALPNTGLADAQVVEQRLREAIPKATAGVALFRRGDMAEDLRERAQKAVSWRVSEKPDSYLRPAWRTTGRIGSKARRPAEFSGLSSLL